MTKKQTDRKNIEAIVKAQEIVRYKPKTMLQKVMSSLGKKRWQDKTPDERSAHMKMMRSKRVTYPHKRKKSLDPN